jgi:hypothetical protein
MLGHRLVQHLTSLPSHPFKITITTRTPSTPPSWLPRTPQYQLISVDYNSHDSLVSVMRGQDIAIALIGPSLLNRQDAMVDAAIEAGVKIFVPADFGIDVSRNNPGLDEVLKLPVEMWKQKAENSKYLEKRVEDGKIKYITLNNGGFFEWGTSLIILTNRLGADLVPYPGLDNGFLGFNYKDRKATIYNGGSIPIHTITSSTIGRALSAILFNPSPYLNRTLYLSTLTYTQNAVLALIEALTGDKWTLEHTTTEQGIEKGKKIAQSAKEPEKTIGGFICVTSVLHEPTGKYVPAIGKSDAEELGLPREDVEKIVGEVAEGWKKGETKA